MSIFQPLYWGVTPRPEQIDSYNTFDESTWIGFLLANYDLLLIYADSYQELRDLKVEEKKEKAQSMSTDQGWRWPPISDDEINDQKRRNLITAELCLVSDQSFAFLGHAIQNLNRQISFLCGRDE